MRLCLSFILLLFLLSSCNDQEQVLDNFKLDAGYLYFPLKLGQFVVYQVDSIIFDPVGEKKIDTISLQVREEIVDTYKSLDEQDVFVIERYERKDASENWKIKNVSSKYFKNNTLISVENNLRFIKLVFPVVEKKNMES